MEKIKCEPDSVGMRVEICNQYSHTISHNPHLSNQILKMTDRHDWFKQIETIFFKREGVHTRLLKMKKFF